ncbi:hypothetical protein CERSUDRAFT_110908 [Gelatoporia subvermispora B]|uniref:Probable methionine--tRNA ligase, mitochondrial n=1 Tax=Ceriporiopsis subvermispora (strain B) TaxID=914234 RepID=M2RN54_CERS8|nr:hypothetical protein CERSUDRAFT_110908 [Gelatoporia subvermispora B]
MTVSPLCSVRLLRHPYVGLKSLRRGLKNNGRSLSSTAHAKPYYVTTPIFYPNAAPHIGHLYSLVVADVIARYARLSKPGRPVKFMTGTDEHGLKIQKAAKAKGMEPLAFCDDLSVQFRNLVEKASISSTQFSRTTDQQHINAVQHLWRALDAQGLIYKDRHAGWYSVSDECFYTDLQVTKAESVPGSSQQPVVVSTETGSQVEWTEEENYKFSLSRFRTPLLDYFKAYPEAIFPGQFHSDIVKSLQDGLEDLSVSRPTSRLTWGVQVPDDLEHTIYVWIDALTVYLSSTGYPWPAAGQGGWPPDVQVIGKDIVRFHAVYLPAMLMALHLPLAKRLLVHSHWTVGQQKMSKSRGNAADPLKSINEYSIDTVRFYLARVGGRFKDDVDWSPEQLHKHAKEAMSLIGNLHARVTSPYLLSLQRMQPDGNSTHTDMLSSALSDKLKTLPEEYRSYMENQQIADALDAVCACLGEANMLMTQAKPWDKKTPTAVSAQVRDDVLECLRICGILLEPFMPSVSTALLQALSIPDQHRNLEFADLGKGIATRCTPGIRLFKPLKKEPSVERI